jgi:predicted nucleotidyltransferase
MDTTTSKSTGEDTPDAIGLAVAQAAQSVAGENTVILFGSRARGDHRPTSDIDLLIVYKDQPVATHSRAKRAISEYFTENPPRLNVDILTISRERFDYCRRAPNHVAGQALRDGVVMSGERLNYSSNYEDEYPNSWPDVKERLIAAYRNLRGFEHNITGLPDDQETYGFLAQQAVENGLKAWISAANLSYRRIHDLDETAEAIFNNPAEANSLAGHQLRMLLRYTSYPDPNNPSEDLNWLTRYAAIYRYSGTAHHMDELGRERFREEINLAVHTLINRAHELTGTSLADLES